MQQVSKGAEVVEYPAVHPMASTAQGVVLLNGVSLIHTPVWSGCQDLQVCATQNCQPHPLAGQRPANGSRPSAQQLVASPRAEPET